MGRLHLDTDKNEVDVAVECWISLYTNTDLSTERILVIQIIFSRHPTDTLSSLSSLSSSSFNESDTDVSNIEHHVTMQCSSTRNDRRPHSDNVPCHTINTLRDVTRLDLASKFLHARIRTCKKKFDQSMPNPQHTGLKGSTSRQLNLSPHHDGLQHELTLISDWRLWRWVTKVQCQDLQYTDNSWCWYSVGFKSWC